MTIEHTNPEIWLTRRDVPGIFWADSRENGHVSDEWFHYWNELDWSRGSIVTPILRAHFPDHQSTRHKMSKISNVLHTPHYLQSCWTATHSTLTLKRGHQDGFIIYLILRIISIITEEADKCLATREALGNSVSLSGFFRPWISMCVIYWSGVTSSRLFLFSLRICLSSWARRIESMFGMFLHLLGKSSWSTWNWIIVTWA